MGVQLCLRKDMEIRLLATLLSLYSLGSAESPCCWSKQVGDAVYSLVTSSLPVPGRCKNSCVYTREWDTTNHHYCFKAGSLAYECLAERAPTDTPAPPFINTDSWRIKIIARSSQDNQPVPGAVADVTLQEEGGQELEVAQGVQFESDGTVSISISRIGLYIVKIRAEGFIMSVVDVMVSCTSADCKVDRLVPMSPELEAGQTRIVMSWDDKPMDVDMHVMAVSKDSGELCRTWFDEKNSCPAASQDLDNTEGGLNGAETVTLLDNTLNSQYTYMIAVEDYKFENGGEHFLKSGTGIIITNGVTTIEREMKAVAVNQPDEFYLFGCLDVMENGSFVFKDAASGTFFNGHRDSDWKDMKENHC